MGPSQAPQQDLVLVGGGHAHSLVLRQFGVAPPPGVRITLVSPDPFTPYSGMLPGLLAGHYTLEETHIDLARLCQWGGVRFLNDTVTGLDPEARELRCAKRGTLAYDILSIDIGSQPELDSVAGARRFATPVKPVAGLWARWQTLAGDETLRAGRIAIVGGGAGSVELALAIAHRLRDDRPAIGLYCGAAQLLEGYSGGTRRSVEQRLQQLGVGLHCDHRVVEVTAGELHFERADPRPFDTLIWSTGAAAAPWIAASGLPVDDRGFMQVHDTLQSTGYAEVFGAGDIATQLRHPRPKAGVYAVRQGPVLARNLMAFASGGSLREHRPQRRFLSLLALGSKVAVAERNGLSASGAWVWRWKNRIDRTFMDRFRDLPDPAMQRAVARRSAAVKAADAQAPCGGCGAKVSAHALSDVLTALRERYPDHVPAAHTLDDAAAIAATAPVLQSIDGLRALVDDPWRMGRIGAQHALSDLYACGAVPHSAQALLTLPFAAAALQQRDLLLLMEGALSVFADAGCRLLGGHSMQGPELQVAFAVNGTVAGPSPLGKTGGRPGDVLLLTGALGSGALFAAHMQLRADGRHIETALAQMERGNAAAAAVARQVGATALTDVTGFGLAGHLGEMLGASLAATVHLEALPVLPGALEAMAADVFSTLHESNRESAAPALAGSDAGVDAGADAGAEVGGHVGADKGPDQPRFELLFDPQTSGGLLLALPPKAVDEAERALAAQEVTVARIGTLAARTPGVPAISIVSGD